jgi:hypothetical protein
LVMTAYPASTLAIESSKNRGKEKGGLLFAATRGLPVLAVSDLGCPASEDPQP